MAMDDRKTVLARAAQHGQAYLEAVADRPVGATITGADLRRALGGPLGAAGTDPAAVLDALAHHRLPGAALLRLRDRGQPSGRHRRGLAGLGLGSE